MLKPHLNAHLGGDIDDLCALAMALNWPDVELLAVTTGTEISNMMRSPARLRWVGMKG